MSNHRQQNIPKRYFRAEQQVCPVCKSFLKRSHIHWRKCLIFLTGAELVVSWAHRCPNPACTETKKIHISQEAEMLHLKPRSYSRELIVQIGYRRYWMHQTISELHQWLSEDLKIAISERQVLNILADFLALLRAAQGAKIRQRLEGQDRLIIGIDGRQPEKGNTSLFVVREARHGLTLMAENLEESSHPTLNQRLFEPLKSMAGELDLRWQGVVSEAQESIRLAVAQSLPGTPHQVCQFHCLSEAGRPNFEADRNLKKRLKGVVRKRLNLFNRRLKHLPSTDLHRSVLVDYADAIRVTLLAGGVSPFELGGLRVYDDLDALAASLTRCQKKGITNSYMLC